MTERNPYHLPAGSSEGGQFTTGQLDIIGNAARKAAGLKYSAESLTDLYFRTHLKGSPKEIGAATVKVYRVGANTEQEVYFGDSPESIAAYSSLHKGFEINEYTVTANNILAAKNQNQLSEFFFHKELDSMIYEVEKNSKFSITSVKAYEIVQHKIMDKARTRGFDAIFFVAPAKPAKYEFVLLK